MEGAEKCWIVVKALVDAEVGSFRQSHRASLPRSGASENSRYVRADSGWPAGSASPGVPDDWPEDMHPLRKDAMDYRLALNRRLIPKRIRLSMRATASAGDPCRPAAYHLR